MDRQVSVSRLILSQSCIGSLSPLAPFLFCLHSSSQPALLSSLFFGLSFPRPSTLPAHFLLAAVIGQSCFEAARMVSALGRAGVLAQEKPLTERNIASLLRRGCENGYQPACDGLLDFEARLAAAAAADATAAPPQPQPAAPATEEH